MSWDAARPHDEASISISGWLRVALRAALLVVLLLTGLALMLVVRLVERPLYGLHRPWTPYITQAVCQLSFLIMGMRHEVQGAQMKEPGAVVANHASWLDIFTLNASKRVYFVSKSEVARWPGIGFLARVTGTVFINRDPREAKLQQEVFEARLLAGHKLLFFPEGTSTDGLRVLPFKPTLFQAFFAPSLRETLFVQPVTVLYRAADGQAPRFYGWWGDMGFGPHLVKTLAAGQQGSVTVIYHVPLRVADFDDRKALARAAEATVRAALPQDMLAAGAAYDAGL